MKVFDDWLSFDAFLTDMGERPDGKTLDRINPFGNYEPTNCRWATPAEQQLNHRTTKRYPFRGEQLTIKEIATATGLSWATVDYRVKQGWTEEQIASPASSVPVALRDVA